MDRPRTLGRFEITGHLGSGGMGEVWRARDPELGREVALKVLPRELLDDADRRARFQREARAAARLNHPNITTIHEVGRAGDRDFIAFELVEGRTLAELARERPLDTAELLELAVPIAEALAYAHEQGVVHRDLKPANVMVDARGRPKLLDFGLAKLAADEHTAAPGDAARTLSGQVFGTPNAMSPEQAAGRPVDARSDVFSFGALLYELGAGHPPFERETLMETVSAVIHEQPPSLRAVRRELPAGFARVVERALEKDPAARYQTMGELAEDLRGLLGGDRVPRPVGLGVAVLLLALTAVVWATLRSGAGADPEPAPTAQDRRSIAVLPFRSLSDEPADRAFAAGVHGDVLTQIAKVGDLRVIASSSVARFAGGAVDPAEIGRTLDVAALLEGSVQRAGDQVRITLNLIDTATGETLWAERYDRAFTVEDLFALQSDVAGQVALELDARLTDDERARIATLPTTSTEAYEAYLLAQEVMSGREVSPDAVDGAFEHLERALELDPGFVEARANLGAAILLDTWLGEADPARRAEAATLIEDAYRVDPTNIEVLSAAGLLAYQERDYARAFELLDALVAIAPNENRAWSVLAPLRRRSGDFEGALEAYTQAVRVAPLDAWAQSEFATTYAMLGRYEEADARYARALELSPDFADAALERVRTRLVRTAELDEARRLWDEYLAAGGDPPARARWSVALELDDPATALAAARELPERTLTQTHDDLAANLRGIARWCAGDGEAAREDFAAALAELGDGPDDDPRTGMARCLTLAGLGEREAALAAGRAALEALPYERDAIVHPLLALDFATALAMLGEDERAIEWLARCVEWPGRATPEVLGRDARTRTLRSHPRWPERIGTGTD